MSTNPKHITNGTSGESSSSNLWAIVFLTLFIFLLISDLQRGILYRCFTAREVVRAGGCLRVFGERMDDVLIFRGCPRYESARVAACRRIESKRRVRSSQ
jgi:hypothetical protein